MIEFGRTHVAVVSSGAKSILDLPLTLEVLETQGVPILGFQTDSLPAFYAPSSGLPIDQRVESALQAAQIIQAAQTLGALHGILVAVPVPADKALEVPTAEHAIEQATREAEKAGISGNAITPFVLNRVSQLTDGASLEANTALLVNNSRVAGQIARELSRLQLSSLLETTNAE